ncbi:MAG: gliding motility-associated ABC transporter ATP-binding subunit GldA [Mangrovibacterium sp.]
MTIRIENLRKTYGEQVAIDNISFQLEKGELVGFLGPNGAGKSTTMRIMTGYLAADAGEVWFDEEQVTVDNHKLRAQIGYLPEHNPLYTDLYVKEYLNFTAGMYGLKNKSEAVDRVVEMTGLGKEQRKKIGELSKGYRQRVGLAQALIHDPKLLILDEPTTGLDPNQLEEIRGLIKSIAAEKTVFFSTHIMQEVEAICNRVLIINDGKLIADNTADAIKSGGLLASAQQVLVEFTQVVCPNALMEKLPLSSADVLTETKFLLTANSAVDIRPLVFNCAVQNGWTIIALTEKQASLEAVFQQLTM